MNRPTAHAAPNAVPLPGGACPPWCDGQPHDDGRHSHLIGTLPLGRNDQVAVALMSHDGHAPALHILRDHGTGTPRVILALHPTEAARLGELLRDAQRLLQPDGWSSTRDNHEDPGNADRDAGWHVGTRPARCCADLA